jgi:superfamily II DNA/RNA helicase
MDGFSKGQQKILVTTDLASRVLDLVNVSHVINFDMPKHAEEFVHRIGRTGRAGTKGDAIAFVGPKDWISFKNVEALLEQTIKFDVLEGFKAKFKGLKPPKAKVAPSKKSTNKKVNQKNKPQQAPNRVKTMQGKEAGDMPMKRKPRAILKPDDDVEE